MTLRAKPLALSKSANKNGVSPTMPLAAPVIDRHGRVQWPVPGFSYLILVNNSLLTTPQRSLTDVDAQQASAQSHVETCFGACEGRFDNLRCRSAGEDEPQVAVAFR